MEPRIDNRSFLSVLCASIVSTDGMQLGTKLLLSRAAVLCPGGIESWREELQSTEPNFVQDKLLYIRSIEPYEHIVLMPRSIITTWVKID